MPKKSKSLKKLREQIAQKAESWLKANVPEYLLQQADWSDVSPEEFLKETQVRRWLKKEQPIDTFGDGDKGIEFERMDILKTIEKNSKLVILGDPGLGKTTTLQFLIYQYAKENKNPLPIYLKLKYYSQKRGLEGLAYSAIEKDIAELEEENNIFLLDGFNELDIDGQRGVLSDLQHLCLKFRNSRWLITSRKVAYPRGLDNWSTCEILELDDAGIQKYLNKYFIKQSDAQDVWKLLEN